ncbi:MAG: helix-turn-helix transcriptional regulator [Clostridia bacterium]|nr:helix-turn-helix transcriptional regulator [Clostridia bacterium]
MNADFPRYRMMCHWHVEYELIRVIKGELHLRIEESDFVLSAGESIMIHGGTLHSGEPRDCVYECSVFSINPLVRIAGCREQLAPILENNVGLSRVYKKEDTAICEAVNDFFTAISEEKNGYKLAAFSGLYRIFSIIIEKELYFEHTKEKPTIESRYIKRFKNVLTWLEEHYRENITLDELADVAGFSPKYFCRLFSKMTGRSPIDYLNCYRIDRASEMLLSTDKPIIDIAAECGFYDLSYFVKVFKKYKNVPPGQYRKRIGE